MRTLATLLVACTLIPAAEPTYEAYGRLLDTYVCPAGVSYAKAVDDPLVDTVDAAFRSMTRQRFEQLSTDAQIAFLVNAYNFYTVKLILEHYPLLLVL